ncbi:DUF6286 domain-containing protein [Streptomyces sp. NPDC006879]|uniref:DUF6286 domain-containing protein n=1 Tax=Streptomyces sp. NPDC006879 TaxID=3364767 RepID=UPI00369B793D
MSAGAQQHGLPGTEATPTEVTPTERAAGSGRLWSTRRLPAALVAFFILGTTALFLYDLAEVRAHRPAMHWRRALTATLAEHRLDAGWVVAGAVGSLLLGGGLVYLAVTPGLRDLLPMRQPEGAEGVRAALDRKAACVLVRDRAMEVSGVRAVRVHMARSQVTVHVDSHFRELADVRSDLDHVMAVAVAELGLARTPQVRIRVNRAKEKR